MSKLWIAVGGAVIVGGGIAAAALLGPSGPPAAPPAAQAAPAAAQPSGAAAVQPGDHVLGKADAPVTIIEYASLTCPHCATFHEATLPKLKSDYIDTGKVKLVYRDFPLDRIAFKAAALAECMPQDRYFPFLGLLFQSQANWANPSEPAALAALTRLAKLGGMSEEKAASCMADDSETLNAVAAESFAGEKEFGIRSTPTFVIGGKTYSGALTFEQVQELLKPLLR